MKVKITALLLVLALCISVFTTAAFAAIDGTAALAATGIDAVEVPRIDITTENGNGASLQKDDGYVNATIKITDTDGSVLNGSVSFKVRGNSTAMTGIQKKAFTFKFAKKTEVLGMGKGKKWAMLANCFDPTLLRNYTAIDFARELGLPYTSEQRFVELWLDGDYRGCYTVYEPVQEGKDRVDIDIESNGGMKDFLIEHEESRVEDDVSYFTVGGVRFAVSEPEEPNSDQLKYITGVMGDIVAALKRGDEAEIREKIDVDSFASFYLLNEFIKNADFGFSSVYFFYKDGKLYAGPAWDYDLSLGNLNANLNSANAKAASVPDGIYQTQRNLYRWLCSKDWFMEEVKNIYRDHYEYIQNISADGGLMDTLRAQYADVFALNFQKWNVRRQWMNYQRVPLATYEENFAFLKNWCAERNAWLTEYYDLFPEPVLIVGDADGSGVVNILDATVIQRVLANLPTESYCEQAADADLNGEVDILDATAIQRWLVSFSGHEEIGQPIG